MNQGVWKDTRPEGGGFAVVYIKKQRFVWQNLLAQPCSSDNIALQNLQVLKIKTKLMMCMGQTLQTNISCFKIETSSKSILWIQNFSSFEEALIEA